MVWAGHGITAGAVHATIELMVLLIQWMDETVSRFRPITATLCVDDSGFEAAGPRELVKRTVVGATGHFTGQLQAIGMDFSLTKNVCTASNMDLARAIAAALPQLRVRVERTAKSLGGRPGSGQAAEHSAPQEAAARFPRA